MTMSWPRLRVEAGFGLSPRAPSTWPLVNGDNATFQRGTGSWAAVANCEVGWAKGIAPAPYRNSLGITCTAAGTVQVRVSSAADAVVAGVSYTFSVLMRAATAARFDGIALTFKDSSGGTTGTSSNAGADTTSGWTTLTVTGTAPANSTQVDLDVSVTGCALGEQHYLAGPDADRTTTNWTDITRYVAGKVSLRRSSRQYERGRFEAGTATIRVNNADGRFTMGNGASPYWPYVRPIVPVRVRAVWDGQTYRRWAGVVERWPVSWADPALSLPEITCVDALAVLSQGELRTTYEEEVRRDGPVSFFTLTETQSSPAAGDVVSPNTAVLVPSKFGGADSEFGSAALVYDGGSSLLLNPGGTVTACDYLDLSTAPGMIPTMLTGWTLEVWAGNNGDIYPDTNSPLFSHLVAGTTAQTAYQIIVNRTGVNEVSLAVGGSIAFDSAAGLWTDRPMYFTIVMEPSAAQTRFYVNGGLVYTGAPFLGTPPTAAVLGGDWYATTTPKYLFEGRVSHFALYDYPLSATRIAAHYTVGTDGAPAAELTGTRVDRILTYARWPTSMRSIQPGISYAGSAGGWGLSGLGGQAPLAAGQDYADAEAGQLFTAADGSLVFEQRDYRPSQQTWRNLWDGANGLPYQLPELAFDADPTYIINRVTLTRDGGAEQSTSDSTSADDYLPRAHTQTLKLRDDTDVSARANLLLSVYKDPRLRLSGFSFVPSHNPAVLFPVALALDISDRQRLVHRPVGATAITYDGYVDSIAEEIMVEHGGATEWRVDTQTSPALVDYWQLAASRATVAAGAGLGATSLSLNALPDAASNRANLSWATGSYDVIRAGVRVGGITVTAVPDNSPGYATFTVTTSALPVAVNTGDTICSPLPPGTVDATIWDSRSVLDSTTRLGA